MPATDDGVVVTLPDAIPTCEDCGGLLPPGRSRGRCFQCQGAHARAARGTGSTRAIRVDSEASTARAELRALGRCVDALDDLPAASRVRAIRYLWAMYGSGQGDSKDSR